MNKPISEKLSKKAKRELARKYRTTWDINPVTRKPNKSSAYNRARVQANNRRNCDK